MIDVLIVGAGIAGLMAANALQENGYTVLIVDKGRGVGGRMATRRIGSGRIDHGAQFFTVRHPSFQKHVDWWLSQNLTKQWSLGWSEGSATELSTDGYPRYVGIHGMSTIPKFLANRLTIHKQTRLEKVTAVTNQWQATTEDGTIYNSRALLMTPPVPQTLELLTMGKVPLATQNRTALERITYAPCVAGLFLIDGNIHLPYPGAIQRPNERISWIADNKRKGISPDELLVTVHANPELSWELWNVGVEQKVALFSQELRPFLTRNSQFIETQIHRWRFAIPTSLHPERTLLADGLPPLAFAGDAFKEPRVEGAALSGLAAAELLANQLPK
ncbi:MAG: NAD(P)-binding protein [Chloroflexi bacterium]|nr:NAD(P)-binding protein [Chloroflexota bacterium]